jgi:alpha-tubulin suppressor-like RCC1 family protein
MNVSFPTGFNAFCHSAKTIHAAAVMLLFLTIIQTSRAQYSVAGWGFNGFTQSTAPPDASKNIKAIAAGGNHTVALKETGTVIAWGYNIYGQVNVPSGLTNVKAIAAGEYHTVALKEDGTVLAWGLYFLGQNNVPSRLNNI